MSKPRLVSESWQVWFRQGREGVSQSGVAARACLVVAAGGRRKCRITGAVLFGVFFVSVVAGKEEAGVKPRRDVGCRAC